MTDTVHGTVPATERASDAYRWTQLAIGVGAMVMIANYQYGWTFFVPDIQKKFGWDRASIQWAFTLFVLFETWLVPIDGWFVDKYGQRIVVLIGGILCAIGWAMNVQATSLHGYYLGMILAGIGAGGLMVTANLKPIAVDWKVDAIPVTLIGMTMTAVTFAATIDRVLNGLTRPFFGWVSDMIGRENTMFLAFGMEGIGIWGLYM